jgi:hypothetical protein
MRASNECELNTVHDKAILAGETVTLKEKTCDSADTFCEEVWQHTDSTRNKSSNSNVESNVTVAKDSIYQRPIIDGEVPSSGSLSSASTSTSSPIVKPIGSRNEEQIIPDTSPLGGTSRPIIGWNSPLDLRSGASPLFPQHRNALPVPTQEQRNEAAKQLREFQSAQIQRILYEKKLAEALKNNLHTTLTAIGDASSSNSFLGNRQVLKPPPGLTQQFVIQNVHDHNNQDDKSFLTDNELFLSKLLDDDDEDVEIPPPRIGIESMLSNEMSLDPSAAPFISERAVVQDAQPSQQSKDERADAWQSSPTTSDSSFEKPLSESSNLKIRGVYGGNVW